MAFGFTGRGQQHIKHLGILNDIKVAEIQDGCQNMPKRAPKTTQKPFYAVN